MKVLLCATVIIAVFGAFALAYPSVDVESPTVEFEDGFLVHSRNRRSPDQNLPKIYAEGSHDRRAGSNIYVQGQQRLWLSQNGRNEIHAQGSYGQHFGGPGGRSPPSFGGGLMYRHRF